MPRDTATFVELRRFSVHAAADGRHRAEPLHAPGHEAAAVAFLEACSPATDIDGALTVIVHDRDTGREHRFRLSFDDPAPACA